MERLDDPSRLPEIQGVLARKPGLRRLYREFYNRYRECLAATPAGGGVLELGAGAGFAREAIPEIIASDVLPYAGLDLVADGTRLPFADGALRLICMTNVFHHIPDAAAFLAEASRCLKRGGRMLIIDQHPGLISGPILKFAHHEPFRPDTEQWAFATSGPLSGANGALAWVVFVRDRGRFEGRFPELELVRYRPHTPLRYWLCGGLKNWCLLPGWAFPLATAVDGVLSAWPRLGSFVDVELVRR